MSETPPELPAAEPTDLVKVKAQLGIPADDASEDGRLVPIVAAVCDMVRDLPIASKALGEDTWPDRIVLGASMLGARLYRRKDTPDGVVDFGSDGPVYVQRNDPDIAQLLQLGAYSKPRVVG